MDLRALISLVLLLSGFNAFAFNEEKFAQSLGMERVLEGNPYTFLGVHTVYADEDLSRQMLVMNDVQSKLEAPRILKSKDYLIVEIPNDEKSYTSMALVGVREEEVKLHWKKTSSIWNILIEEFSIIKTSHAQDCLPFGISLGAGIEGLQNFLSSPLGRNALNCLGDVAKGAWGSTGGFALGIGQGIKNLIKDPKGFWDDKVAHMKSVVNFIKSFSQNLTSSFPSLASLPAEAKLSFFCGLTGGIGGSLLLTALTGGGTFWKVMGLLTTTLRHIVALAPAFDVLKNTDHIKHMPKEFFTKLQQSPDPQRLVNEINRAAQIGKPELILQKMRTI
jgi:hypothetical protein